MSQNEAPPDEGIEDLFPSLFKISRPGAPCSPRTDLKLAAPTANATLPGGFARVRGIAYQTGDGRPISMGSILDIARTGV
jgi:hypothetical protein